MEHFTIFQNKLNRFLLSKTTQKFKHRNYNLSRHSENDKKQSTFKLK